MDERLSRGGQPCIHLLFRGTRGLFRGKVASDLDSSR
jgi:hypothetical protein